jgi:3'-5' exoribonuclease
MNKFVDQLRHLVRPHTTHSYGFGFPGGKSPAEKVCDKVLDDPRFSLFPASISKHHAWEGGLAEHTFQVVRGVIDIAKVAPEINACTVVVAALWHDYGKVFDYEFLDGAWVYAKHKVMVSHLSRSYSEFMQATSDLSGDYCDQFRMEVGHCILAHHGQHEYGSPVLPQTREAWAVHLADMISVHCIEDRK